MIACFKCWWLGHQWKWLTNEYMGKNHFKQFVNCARCGKKKPYELVR